MLSEENLRILVPAFIALLGIILTFLFTKSHYQRTRKWELKDRQFKEAYACLNGYRNLVEVIENFEIAMKDIFNNQEEYSGLSQEQTNEKITKKIGSYGIAYGQVPKLFWDVIELNTSIVILGDRKLSGLDDELRTLIISEVKKLGGFEEGLANDESFDIIKGELDGASDFSSDAHFLIKDMKLRLDTLAQKV